MDEPTRDRTKKEIRRQLKRFLHNAREKEAFLLQGLAAAFCQEHRLAPEQVELVREKAGDITAFYFRRRAGALFLPKDVV